MKIVKLSDLLKSNSLYFREDVDKIRVYLKQNPDSLLDFEAINKISPSSAHELLSLLRENPSIKILNLSESISKIIESQIKLRNVNINLKDYSAPQTHLALA